MASVRTTVAGTPDAASPGGAALEQGPVLLWTARADGTRDWLSPGWAARTGRPLAGLLGDGWLGCVEADDAQRWRGIVAASGQAHQPYELDLRLRVADGTWRWMLEQAATRFDAHGEFVGYAGALVDIDARKESEERIAERARALRVAERGHARFLSVLSHALRGPLAPIGNVASVLRTLEEGQPALVRLREILERQVERTTHLITDLVDRTLAAQGRVSIVNEVVDAASVVRSAIEASGRALAEGGHRVELDLPDAPLAVRGDAPRLSQAIAQLIGNAARFSPAPGPIRVAVQAAPATVRITVQDFGQGIEPSFLPHVFELFAQEERPDGRRPTGLGVGLTLARRIVQLHGGDITATSGGRGRGATFVVELPLLRTPVATREAAAADQPFRVLVVDADPGAAHVLRREMEMWGNEVRVVADEAEALSLAADYDPQLVLCGLDGEGEAELERFDPLRRRFAGGRTLFAVVGEPRSAEEEARALARGYDSFLVKPLQPAALARLLRACAPAAA
ncbi:MAG TPA: ATP-binding protein [Caldimonas sp.]|nr:ATP-binding protein [Caldimonas sp.]